MNSVPEYIQKYKSKLYKGVPLVSLSYLILGLSTEFFKVGYMLQIGLVFLGGGLGSLCRYGIARLLSSQAFQFPMATLLANIISCIILGYCTGLVLKDSLPMSARLLIMTGFCGGFSTFSTFTGETFLLMEGGNHLMALLNIGGSILICLVCFYLGMLWAK